MTAARVAERSRALVTLVFLTAVLALPVLAGCGGDSVAVTGAATSIVMFTPTTEAEIPATTTTAAFEVTTTSAAGSGTETTAGGSSGIWQTSPTSLQDLAASLAQELAPGQTVYLPGHLPEGWALAAPGQDFGDIVAGYFADVHTNPTIIAMMEQDSGPFAEHFVAFTDGTDVVGQLMVIGDWGESPFEEVIAYGKKLAIHEDESLVVVLPPGWTEGAIVASPGGREAALEIAASMKAW